MSYSIRSYDSDERNLVVPHPEYDEVRFISTEIQEWFLDEFYALQDNVLVEFLCLQWTTS